MKKQIFFTFFVLLCALFVFALSFLAPSDQSTAQNIPSPVAGGALMSVSAEPPPVTQSNNTAISRPVTRLYLFKGLPFELNGIKLISIIQITLMAIFIGLFIKPCDPKMECIFDSDGKK